jgi:glutamate synthase (NADPH/NADH) small chain
MLELPKAEPNHIKVAVIGSGPAGITISIKLAQLGYDVTVFESKTDIGGVLRYGIPDFRLPRTIIDRYKTLMLHLGIKIKVNVTIGKAFGVEELFRDGFKAISIGTGVTWPIALNIKGETLGNVHYGVHFLEKPENYQLGKSMIVIGAGNVAMDVARTGLRMGVKDVKVVVRSDRYTASKEEKEYAEIEGAEFIFNKAPVEITDEGVLFADTVCDENHNLRFSASFKYDFISDRRT